MKLLNFCLECQLDEDLALFWKELKNQMLKIREEAALQRSGSSAACLSAASSAALFTSVDLI
ncbi:hypothetical protein A2U01_0093749 [Trifolium medium]|uniref:Uncharacterized protein n=1 Tax=Trifolium medium TaxID=97028 RepID=A0A392UJ57_9FABA|nr:hypothetical protein [Trifolium medium]